MSNKVQKLDHRTHILKLPDTYIGSVEKTTEDSWIFNVETGKIQKKLSKRKIYESLYIKIEKLTQ